jgi:hypothetical protein
MWRTWFIVVAIIFLGGAGLKWLQSTRRRRAVQKIQETPIRITHGVYARVMVRGMTFRGFRSGHQTKTTVDMVLTQKRLLVVSNRGTLFDIRAEAARGRIGSVRCTGPGRLLFEGERQEASKKATNYRVEISLSTATSWAQDLAPFADEVVVAGL